MSNDDKPGTPKDSHYARLRRAHRDAMGNRPNAMPRPRPGGTPPEAAPDGLVRLYGLHTVRAALDNPRRRIVRLMVTRNALARLGLAEPLDLPFPAEIVEPRALDRLLGADAVHQGVLVEAQPLVPKRLGQLADTPLLIVLDQVTDPHNVGAIMRSAVAFGAGALITTARHSPAESGVLAKAASGALEHVPLIAVSNLAHGLAALKARGFEALGFRLRGFVLLAALRLDLVLLLTRLLLQHVALDVRLLLTHLDADRARTALGARELQLALRLALERDLARRARRIVAAVGAAQMREQLHLLVVADACVGALHLDARLIELHQQPIDRHLQHFSEL